VSFGKVREKLVPPQKPTRMFGLKFGMQGLIPRAHAPVLPWLYFHLIRMFCYCVHSFRIDCFTRLCKLDRDKQKKRLRDLKINGAKHDNFQYLLFSPENNKCKTSPYN